MKLDIKDFRILVCLDEDARMPINILAKKTRLNPNTAAYRLSRLEREKYILGYYALIDNSKLGLIGFRVYLRFIDTDTQKEAEILNCLKKLPEIHVLSTMDGIYDAGFVCWVSSVYQFKDIWQEFKQKYKRNIGRYSLAIFTKVYHLSREYFVGERKDFNSLIVGGSETELIDETDRRILQEISSDARVSTLELSRRIAIPVRTLAFRIRRLEQKKIILGYKAILNLDRIGYKYYKINLVLNDLSILDRLLEFSKMNKYVTYIDTTISLNDFEFDVEVPSREEYFKLLSELKNNFPSIKDFEEFTIRKYLKLVYF